MFKIPIYTYSVWRCRER